MLLNIIIPAMAIVAIALYGLNKKPLRHRWIWKAVPILYAFLVLWDFISHMFLIKSMLHFQPLIIFQVILILSLNIFAVYFSWQFGFYAQKTESESNLSIESKFGRWYSVTTKILFVICALSVAINFVIILRGFHHVGLNNKVPFVYTHLFQYVAVVVAMPWLFGLSICSAGILFGLALRSRHQFIIPSFIILVVSIASVVLFYFYENFWVFPIDY